MIKMERFEKTDAKEYFELTRGDESVKKFFRLAYAETIEEAENLMEICINSYKIMKLLKL